MSEKENKSLATFSSAIQKMIATNESSYNITRYRGYSRWYGINEKYSLENINQIIDHGSLESKIDLSRYFFETNGFYRRLLLHYATLLKYTSLLIPNPSFGKSLSESYVSKKYYGATNFIDSARLPKLFTHIAIKALRDGCYYGILQKVTNTSISVMDLPVGYCRSRFKDEDDNDLIEFNVLYFDSITDETLRKSAQANYPKELVNWYKKYKLGKVKTKWCFVPAGVGICIPMFDGAPMFLNIIPAAIEYDQAKDINRKRDLEEIRKIIVQRIPHLADGGFLLEPDEAEEMHRGTVQMMKGNENVSVLTTYADVDAIVSKTANDAANTSVEKALLNIYAEAGSSSQLFGTESNLSLETSINNDMALMLTVTRKLENFITYVINSKFGNSNITFSYKILPITHYNVFKYVETSLKLANSGYSFLLPALAMDISQKELNNIKDLENDVLKLKEKLIPLSTSYTETGNVGRPEKDAQDKSAKTEANEESLDNGGSK